MASAQPRPSVGIRGSQAQSAPSWSLELSLRTPTKIEPIPDSDVQPSVRPLPGTAVGRVWSRGPGLWSLDASLCPWASHHQCGFLSSQVQPLCFTSFCFTSWEASQLSPHWASLSLFSGLSGLCFQYLHALSEILSSAFRI